MISLDHFEDDSRSIHICAKEHFTIPELAEVEGRPEDIHIFDMRSPNELLRLRDEIVTKVERLGFTGFVDLFSETGRRVPFYGGMGVTYNPRYAIPVIPPLHQVLGSPRINLASFFACDLAWEIYRKLLAAHQEREFLYDFLNDPSLERIESFRNLSDSERAYLREFAANRTFRSIRLRDSYADSWGFRHLTEVASEGALNALIASIPMQIVRSRIAVLRPREAESSADLEKLWHRDEDPLLESRLVIPIVSHSGVFLEVRASDGVKRMNLEVGRAYSWNTALVHRVVSDAGSSPTINLVLGFSPWIDIDDTRGTLARSKRFGQALSRGYSDGSTFPFLAHRAAY